jgi:hypothetical protein
VVFFNQLLDGVRVVAGAGVVDIVWHDDELACMLVLQICRHSHGVLHLHFVDDAPRSGWCSRRRLARHRGDNRGCIA